MNENKNENKVDKIIEDLCGDLTPCKRLANPFWRSLLWILITVSYVFAVAMIIGPRPHMMEKITHHFFIFEIGLAMATGITASIVTFLLSVPDARGKDWMISIPATLFLVQIFWILLRLFKEGEGLMPYYWFDHCWMDTILVAGLPSALVVFLIRKGATVRPYWLAWNALLAVASFGWIGIRFMCPFDAVGKAYFINYLPFVMLGLLLGFLARKIFKW